MSPPPLTLLQVPAAGLVLLLPVNILHNLKGRVPWLEVALG